MAAGASSRLGQPKQLLELNGQPLLQHAVDAAEGAGLSEVLVVLGHRFEEVAAALRLGPGTAAVVNQDYALGQATSLRAGLRAAHPGSDAALVILGDQPALTSRVLRTVADVYRQTGAPVVQASYDGCPGHPVLFDRRVWADLETIEGDRGARELLRQHPEWVTQVELGGEVPADLDTWQDYERMSGGRPITRRKSGSEAVPGP